MSDTSAPAAATPSAPSPQVAPAPAAPVTPGSPEWAAMTTEARHEQLRGPANPRSRGYSPAVEQREAAAVRAAGEPPKDQAVVDLVAPAAASTEKLKVGKYEVSEAELAGMMDRQAQDDLRAATRPASPEAYKSELPADLKLPGGQIYTFDQNDPSLVAARNWAHAKGLSQDDYSQVLGIYASHVAGQEAALAERSRAEVEKAGANAPQRVAAISTWIRGEVGDTDAKPILATIVTDAHVRFYEKLWAKQTSQGVASFSQSHRVPPDTAGIPGFANMSFEQRRFAQDQLTAQRRDR